MTAGLDSVSESATPVGPRYVPECPHCRARSLETCDVFAGWGSESFEATHRCKACHAPLRVTPPDASALRRIATTALVAPPGAKPSADPATLPVKEIT